MTQLRPLYLLKTELLQSDFYGKGWKEYKGKKPCIHCGRLEFESIADSSAMDNQKLKHTKHALPIHLSCIQSWWAVNKEKQAEITRRADIEKCEWEINTARNHWLTSYGPPYPPGTAINPEDQGNVVRECHFMHRTRLESIREKFTKNERMLFYFRTGETDTPTDLESWPEVINDFGMNGEFGPFWEGWFSHAL